MFAVTILAMDIIRKIKPFFTDARGEMSHLLDGKISITSALLITSKKGSTRANHYHKKDTHYAYMLKGKMEYSYKGLSSKGKEKTIVVSAGEIVHTPPNTIHRMKFVENSVFLALTTEPRDQDEYEKDTVRVP